MVEDPRFVPEIATDRTAGYADALAAAGIAYRPDLVVRPRLLAGDRIDVDDLLRTLLESNATAAFFATSTLGMEALRHCATLGIRVPGDLALAAYDDEPAAARLSPPLTAVRQPVARIATEAVRLLMRLIDGDAVPPHERQRVVPVELVVRASSLSSTSVS